MISLSYLRHVVQYKLVLIVLFNTELLLILLQPFYSSLSGTTWVSWHTHSHLRAFFPGRLVPEGHTILDFAEAEMMGGSGISLWSS